MRPADRYLYCLTGTLLATAVTWLDGWEQCRLAANRLTVEISLVATLGLTDLALYTEARYTRHPALADWHGPFQDGPSSLDHFPSVAFTFLPSPPP